MVIRDVRVAFSGGGVVPWLREHAPSEAIVSARSTSYLDASVGSLMLVGLDPTARAPRLEFRLIGGSGRETPPDDDPGSIIEWVAAHVREHAPELLTQGTSLRVEVECA